MATPDQNLFLPFNQLSEIPAEIGDLTELTVLNLYRNNLTKLPASIIRLNLLTRLDLDSNVCIDAKASAVQDWNTATPMKTDLKACR